MESSSVQSLYDFFDVEGEQNTFKTEVKEKIAEVPNTEKQPGDVSSHEDLGEDRTNSGSETGVDKVLSRTTLSSGSKKDLSSDHEKGSVPDDVDPLGDSNYDSSSRNSSSSSSSDDSRSESSTDSESSSESSDESDESTTESDSVSNDSEDEVLYQKFPQKSEMDTIPEVDVHEADGIAKPNEADKVYSDEDYEEESGASVELIVVEQEDKGILIEQEYSLEVIETEVKTNLTRETIIQSSSPEKKKSQIKHASRPMQRTTCKQRSASDSYNTGLKKREPMQKGNTFKRPNQLSARTVEKITKPNCKASKVGNKDFATQSQSAPGLPSESAFDVAGENRSLSGLPTESVNKSRVGNGEENMSRCSAKGDEAAPKSNATTPTIRERRTVERIVEEIMPESRCGSVARRDAIFSRNRDREETSSAEPAEIIKDKVTTIPGKVPEKQMKGKKSIAAAPNTRVKPGIKRPQLRPSNPRKAVAPSKTLASKQINRNSTYSTTSFNSYRDDFESASSESNAQTGSSEKLSTKSARPMADNGFQKSPYRIPKKPHIAAQIHKKVVFPSIDSKRPVQLTSADLSKRANNYFRKEKPNYIQRNKESVAKREPKKTSRESPNSDIECAHHPSKKSGIAVPLKSEACYRDGQLEVSVFGNHKECSEEGPVDVKITLVHRYLAPVRGPKPYAEYGKKLKDKVDTVFFGSTDRDIIKHRAVYPPFNTHINPEASARHVQYFGI